MSKITTSYSNKDRLFMEKGEYTKNLQFTMSVPDHVNRYMKLKRIVSIGIALVLLLPSLVLIGVFGLLIILESEGGMIFKQERLGYQGKKIFVYKLRSMQKDAFLDGPLFTEKNDSRITKIGKIVRRFRIDELPQLINIIKGDMCFLGPRPLTSFEYTDCHPDFFNRLLVVPGISGLAQINGGNELNNQEKLAFDLEYIRNVSFLYDIKIGILTLKTIIFGHGAR